jgi:hypothetical protein
MKMKRKLSIISAILAAATLFTSGLTHAGSYVLPLSGLVGNWAGQGTATFAVCLNSDFSAVEDCSIASNSIFVNEVLVTQQTTDAKGHFCQTETGADSQEFPSPPGSANTFIQINVGKVSSYNQATETGTINASIYDGDGDTYCNGSVLVNTVGAAPTAISTAAFTVSRFGNRIDAIVQTYQNEPISYLDNLVGSQYLNRQ